MDDIRIEVTNMLNKYNESRFYVYALCEKNENEEIIPFYIGKGEGDRVWAHEDGEEKEREKIKDVDSDEDKDNEISEKYKKIKKLKSQGIEVEKIIIKWGMTEDEAFMAESALINLLKIDNLKVSKNQGLTNIQNGHISKGEKKKIYRPRQEVLRSFMKSVLKTLFIFQIFDVM